MQYRIFLLVIMLPFIGLSQINQCGNLLIEAKMEQKHPGYMDAIVQTLLNAQERTTLRDGDTLTIPVVVHVVYNSQAENLSDQLIADQMEVLNQDFLRTNPDASNTRNVFLDVAGTANIQFRLADTDPNGQPTSGITRTETNVSSFIDFDITLYLQAIAECGVDIFDPESIEENIDCINELLNIDLDQMKSSDTGGIDPWNVDRYLNIWVCNMSIDLGGMQSPFILGYAYPPMEAPNWPEDELPENLDAVDGVVLHYEAVGPNNPNVGQLAGTNDAGRTATHEVGHYLGLRHIWGDGDCTADDFIDDTPLAGSNSQSTDANSVPNCQDLHIKDSCANDNLPDMIENYMDYSIESCQNAFTEGQVDLMRAMLLGPRATLLESNVFTNTPDLNSLSINLYPTQTSGIINMSSIPEVDWSYEVLGINGVIYTQSTHTYDNIIDIGSLHAGIYLIQLIEGERLSAIRIFKH